VKGGVSAFGVWRSAFGVWAFGVRRVGVPRMGVSAILGAKR